MDNQNQDQSNISQFQPLPQTPTTPSANIFKTLLFIIFGLIIIVGAVFAGMQLGKNQTTKQQPITQQQTLSPTEEIVKPTVISKIILPTEPNPTVNPTADWKTYTIDLYKLQLNLPNSWSLKELNRRPEPTGVADPKTGHDCADYSITSNDGFGTLTLKPTCGFADGGSDNWPKDTIIVKDLGDNKFLIRYIDPTTSIYTYAHGSRSSNDELQSGILSFGDNQNLIFIHTNFVYTGPGGEKQQYLDAPDKIVSSLLKL